MVYFKEKFKCMLCNRYFKTTTLAREHIRQRHHHVDGADFNYIHVEKTRFKGASNA